MRATAITVTGGNTTRHDALNVAAIAALFWRKPTLSPGLLPDDPGEFVGSPTMVTTVTTPPSVRVEMRRVPRERSVDVEVDEVEVAVVVAGELVTVATTVVEGLE